MKIKLLLFILLTDGLILFSQPSIKVFAFEQENLPGTKPSGVTDENGKIVQKAAAKKNYFIFLSFNKVYSIIPTEIFVKGKALPIKSITTRRAPVEYMNRNIPSNPEKIVLVPETDNKVLELQMNETPSFNKKTTALQKLTDKNDVVIAYLWKKKKYFLSLKKLKKLEPIANE